MALTKCTECDNEVSDRAKSCPRCGAPLAKVSLAPVAPRLGMAVVLFVVFLGLSSLATGGVESIGVFMSVVAAVVIAAIWDRMRS